MRKVRTFIIGLLLCIVSVDISASIETRSNRVYGTNLLIPGSFIISHDDKFPAVTGAFTNVSNKAIVEFGIDEEKHLLHTGYFKLKATFDVELTDVLGNTTTQTNNLLEVDYNPQELTRYKDKAQLIFTGVYKVKVYNMVITYCNISNTCFTGQVTQDAYLQATVSTERLYNFTLGATMPVLDVNWSVNPTNNELTVYWDYFKGAEEYELEYTHIDDYDLTPSGPAIRADADIKYDFDHDATRIVTTFNNYIIPLNYERGYILYRMRPIGKTSAGVRLEGGWNIVGSSGDLATFKSGNPNFANYLYYVTATMNSDNINWTATKTFAENGKFGVGVTYKDAVGLNRQNIARLNSENKTIISSTIYDHYARPTFNMLPSPYNSLNFNFKTGLNKVTISSTTSNFDKQIFDLCGSDLCSFSTFPLDSNASLGAANYYSMDNPNKKAMQMFLPDAKGYPYVQLKYLPDGTGRVARQSLPGFTHQLGSIHDLQYAYVKPTQVELDRLFGKEASSAILCAKNYVVDPNGQTSATYYDPYGRTIATTVVGEPPIGMDGLNDYPQVTLTDNLGNPPTNQVDFVDNCIEVNTSFYVVNPGETQTINYATDLATYLAGCTNLCLDCIYDLEISLKDECGTEYWNEDNNNNTPGVAQIVTIPHIAPFINGCPSPEDPGPCGDCLIANGSFATPGVTVVFPRKGTYYLHKKICVSDKPISDYVELFKQKGGCTDTYCDALGDALAQTNFNCAPPSCQQCLDALEATNPTGQLGTYTAEQYDELYGNCQNLCPKTECEKLKQKLMADFYPNGGQFACTNPTDPCYDYSIFNLTSSNLLNENAGTGLNNFQAPPQPYLNNQSLPAFVTINNVQIAPQNLSQQQYINNYHQSWAEALIPLHPDYCKYKFLCEYLGTSMQYDKNMQEINHYDEACSTGYLIPYSGSFGSYGPSPCTATMPDPFLTNTNIPPATIVAFKNELTTNFNGSTNNIYKESAINANNNSAVGLLSFGANNCVADVQWSEFKQNYVTLKQLYYETLLTAYLAANPHCNVSVPPGFVSSLPDFDVSDLLSEDNIDPSLANPANQTAYTSQVNAAIAVQCSTQCESYKIIWEGDLLAYCPGFASASAGTQALILNGMEAICNLGCDANHPNGSSSANPSNPGYTIPSSSTIAYNFQDIINHYLPSTPCNANVVSSPPPFANSNMAAAYKLNDCRCDQLLKTEYLYNNPALLPGGVLPAGVTSAWQLFEHQNGYDLIDFNTLLCACKGSLANPNSWIPGYVWTNTELTNLASTDLNTDPRLSCKDCLKCTDVVTQLNLLYPNLPVTGYPNVYAAIENNNTNSIIAENILNNYFNVNYDIDDYLDLYEDCQNYTTAGPNYHTFGNNVSQQAVQLFEYLSSMQSANLLTTSHPMKLCTDQLYFMTNLYNGVLPPVTTSFGYQYNVTTLSALQLNFDIYDPATSTIINTINMTLPGTVGGWNFIQSFDSIRAIAQPVIVGGPIYTFVIYAKDLASTVFTITCSNTQFPIATLSQSSPFVPIFCNTPLLPPPNPCAISAIQLAMSNAQLVLQETQDNDIATFIASYKQKCLSALQETFTREYLLLEHNYTLYYYDQPGNLVRTVAPKGVTPLNITAALFTYPLSQQQYPDHSSVADGVNKNYMNDYKFNTYNQALSESTVDGGTTQYFYDQTGRIVASQNAKQAYNSTINANIYSYTLYDGFQALESNGRIKEVGELVSTTPLTKAIAQNYFGAFLVFYNSSSHREVTKTFYDYPTANANVLARFNGGNQKNLRNRVSYVTYEDVDDYNAATFKHASYYSYDQHGNTDQLIQQNVALDASFSVPVNSNGQLKKIDYEYDLISGNMNKATYQKGKADVFIHKYYYDADNRIFETFTSRDNINWDRDAKYIYYEHGPLARIERADKQVQGADYYYTLHGWVKGVNSDALAVNNDIGKDGAATNAYNPNYNKQHNYFAKDAMGYSLNYYKTLTDEDYSSIGKWNFGVPANNISNPVSDKTNLVASAAPFNISGTGPTGVGANLFNGNISSMVTTFIDKDPFNLQANNTPNPQIAAYRYDMLQRITQMKTYRSLVNNVWQTATSGNYDNSYDMSLSYDPNGNIKTLTRNGAAGTIVSGGNLAMDNLSYTYFEGVANGGIVASNNFNSNRLACLQDAVPDANYDKDVDTYINCSEQNPRYNYDEIGNLIKDKGEYIDEIQWTVDRKVKKVIRDVAAMLATGTGPGSVYKSDIEYEYNSLRQRVVKIVKPRDMVTKLLRPTTDWVYTYYVYDISGNVMAIYNRNTTLINSGADYQDKLSLEEQHIYGSDRLAITKPAKNIDWSYTYTACYTPRCAMLYTDPVGPTLPPATNYKTERNLGYKEFELTNHLGNVIATVSDRKLQAAYDVGTCINVYDMNSGIPANIFPQNMTLATTGGSLQCTIQMTGISGIDAKLGTNIPAGSYLIEYDWDPGSLTVADGVFIRPFDHNGIFYMGPYFCNGSFVPPAGHYSFVYTPTMTGPTFSTYLAFYTYAPISNNSFKIDNLSMCPINAPATVTSYTADILMHTDYYAFGQEMPGRTYNAVDYRYAFNGKEKDRNINTGASDFGMREYDERLGKFFSLDPAKKQFVSHSPYSFAGNTPIMAIDVMGERIFYINKDGTKLDLSIKGNISKIDNSAFRDAYEALKLTKSGKILLNYYESAGANHDLYFKESKGHSYQGNWVAATYYDLEKQNLISGGSMEGFTTDPLSEHKDNYVFNGTNVSDAKGKVSAIALSNERFRSDKPVTWWYDRGYTASYVTDKEISDKYLLAETIFHEIYAHVLIPDYRGYNNGDIQHMMYGSKSSALQPVGSFPFNQISRELLELKKVQQALKVIAKWVNNLLNGTRSRYDLKTK